MRRIICLVATLLLLCMSTVAGAHKIVIDVSQFVEHPSLDSILRGFKDQLKDDGFDVDYKVYNAQGNVGTTYQIASQITGDEPDMILAIATPPAQACLKQYEKAPQLKGTPMLFSGITDPLGAGLVTNYEKPGGDVTGMSNRMPMDKILDMIQNFVPGLKRLGFLYNAGEANSASFLKWMREEATRRGIEIQEATVTNSADVQQSAASLIGNVDAIYSPTDNTVISAMEVVAKVCTRGRTPLFVTEIGSVKRGGVACLGFDYYQHGRQTGVMAARILRGEKPGDMPVEFQKDLRVILNPAAAKRMGLKLTDKQIKSADQIIE